MFWQSSGWGGRAGEAGSEPWSSTSSSERARPRCGPWGVRAAAEETMEQPEPLGTVTLCELSEALSGDDSLLKISVFIS